ncbi:hypothetical protein P171DRAFT_23806 [Karstenula rhodostoma CBS 690.94]|uniref:Uncharacterized protein n=1 Tax=Karstenula rhodostoma CBS 690.94 TaxID=1392251 RepID=A0A9P4PJD4_9PLEO|nr:hypothetical protein P171DRAFT_23806 [Karstenula rhodostoma CBS 690.94]
MLPPDRELNASGRNSRASDMSVVSRGPSRSSVTAAKHDILAPAVASMLRTSTEMGNLGGSAVDPLMPNVPRAPRRGGATSRLSIASSHSNASNRTGPRHHHWHSTASAGTRHSREHNMPQYVPDTLSPTVMNVSGSSPLVPFARDRREGHRSLSMTMANSSEPTFRLLSNRSMANLRSHDHPRRPKSPYMYPTRLRRPGYRPASPALSDTAGSYPRRRHGYLDNGLPPYPGQMRLRRPSETSMRRPPSRSQTPVFYGDPHPDIPPVPPLMPHRYAALERERERKSQRSHRTASHKSAKHSTSSGSTNRRFDSDIPSSDSTSPPTPRDVDVLVSPTGPHSIPRSMSGTVNYYDYSEQYESQEVTEPSTSAVPTGFVRHIKTIIEERGTPEPVLKGGNVTAPDPANQHSYGMVPDIPELPASPIPRRITRDLVLAGIGPESSSGEVEISGVTAETRKPERSAGGSEDEYTTLRRGIGSRAVHPAHSVDANNRHSILSQAGSAVMESSTLEFAVRCSIPMVADNSSILHLDNDTTPVYVPDADPTSEDGMTDLLEGYQRTDTRDGSEEGAEEPIDDDDAVEKGSNHTSNHAAKSSDEQSFKSCTDVIQVADPHRKTFDPTTAESYENLPEPVPPFKDLDARSFTTCKDAVTPDRVGSLPASRLPSSQLVASEVSLRRLFSEMPSSSPCLPERNALPSSTSGTGMSRVVGRFRANSRPSSTQGSAGGSFSSLKENGTQAPPAVPPRESSSSREAQQSRGVANFLLRSVRQRFVKASPGSNLRPGKEDTISKPLELDDLHTDAGIPTPPPMRERVLPGNITVSADRPVETQKAPQRVLTKERLLPHQQSETMTMHESSIAPKGETFTSASSATATPGVRQTSLTTPSPAVPEASSVYSPDNVSSTGSRDEISPGTFAQTAGLHRRDSQTTTHLSWTGANGFHPYTVEGARGSRHSQEDSTTDLRLPGFRHTVTHLPDLKEESHEDSSLNTSASNFRPFGGSQPAVFRMSTDGLPATRRHPSVRSSRNSVLQQMHLPSMNFSSFGSFDEALDHRVSRSLDLAPAAREELAQAVMPRSASAAEGREKYKSVFAGLDTPAKTSATRQHAGDPWPRKSPDLLVKEVDSLTIPSVNGLSLRLSEILPQLKEALGLAQSDEFPDEEGIMEKAMERLNEVGLPVQKRSSARLRPVPGSPNMLVVDDEVFKEITEKEKKHIPSGRGLNLDKADLGADIAGQGGSQAQGEAAALVGSGVVAHGRARDDTVNITGLEAPSPAHFREHNSTSLFYTNFSSPSSRPSTRSLRSRGSTITGSVADTRPWNLDKNYPWATDPSVDISLPPPSASKYSPRPGPSHLRNRLSSASSESAGTASQYGTSASPPARRGPTGHCCNSTVDGRRSIESSTVGFDASGYPIGPVRVRDDDQSHGAGERYPTSALSLPSNLHIYPGQASHFSLDTSDEEVETTSPRKTLFSRRPRRNTRASANRRDLSQRRVRELQQSRATGHSTQIELDDLPDRSRRQTFTNAQGMSKVTFCLQSCGLFFKKGLFKLFPCIRPETPVEPDSEPATVPANSRASESSESSDETIAPRVPRHESPIPAIRPGPGRQYTPGFFISFPSLSGRISHPSEEPESAFQSNIQPRTRKYGTFHPEAAGPSASQ